MRRIFLLGALAVAVAVAIGVLARPSASSSTPEPSVPIASTSHLPRGHAPVGTADGVVPDGVTVLDDVPAVANLDEHLLESLRDAAAEAAGDGVVLEVNSGWRSPAYQARLLREAVGTYGSAQEAARWVATPTTSAHVSGDAVDLGASGAAWLAEHGAAYGLCRVYDNAPWHFERRPAAVDDGCPPTYADPSTDPRMQQ
jgi:LAS superfamily LD-carboxypeptidase LdcB